MKVVIVKQFRRRLIAILAVTLITLGGLIAAPQEAVAAQPFNNAAIADAGLAEVGTSRPTGWNEPGECIKSVQRWVAAAGGYFGGGGVISGYVNSGAEEVSLTSAVKGDVIQYTNGNGADQDWSHVHTVVVIDNHGNGTFDIVQSNSPPGSGLVTRVNNWTPSPASGWVSRVWRFGTAQNVEPTPPPEVKGDLTYDGRADLIGISKASDGTPYVNVFEAGSDTFQTPSQWAHPTAGWANWDTKVWLSGSVGNDTATDLIGISRGGDGTPYIHVFPSRGSSFGDPILWAHPTTGWSDWDGKRWLMGDVTGDGKEDLIGISRASNGSAYVNVFRSTGSSFAAPVQWIHASSWTNWDTQQWLVEDFGGDGKEDLMLITPDVDGTPLIHVFPSRGNSFGSASLWAHPTTGWSEWETKVWLVGNMGTDEAADLIGISKGSDGTPYIHVFPSRRSQNQFDDPQLWAHPTTGWDDWEGKRWVVNDYGTDGKEDLIGISRAVDGPYIHVFPSRGDTFGPPSLWAHPTAGWTEWETKVWL